MYRTILILTNTGMHFFSLKRLTKIDTTKMYIASSLGMKGKSIEGDLYPYKMSK